MYAGIACGPQGARRVVCAFGWKGLAQLARTAKRVREALRGLGGSVEVESYRGTAIERRWHVGQHGKRRYLSSLPSATTAAREGLATARPVVFAVPLLDLAKSAGG